MSLLSLALLDVFPIQMWRRSRRASHNDHLKHVLGDLRDKGRQVLTLLVRGPELREEVKAKLIAGWIFPAILWPFEADSCENPLGVRGIDANLSNKLPCIHCDSHEKAFDLDRVANAGHRVLPKAPG